MYRGKKIFRYLNNRDIDPKRRLDTYLEDGDYVVQMTTKQGRFYMKFDSCDSFFTWSKDIHPNEKTFYEVVWNDEQKFRVDLDYKVDNIDFVAQRLSTILEELGLENPNVIGYDIETSAHMVVTNYRFPSHRYCEGIARIVSSFIDLDMGVYKNVQHFRVEGSTKYGQRRWKERLGSLVSFDNFREGALSDTRNTTMSIILTKIPKRITSTSHDVSEKVPRGFRIRSVDGPLILLDRKFPTFCDQCKRVHDKENSYILGNRFYCRRRFPGKLISS